MANRILRSILKSSSYLYWHHWIKARHLKLLQLKTKLVDQRLDGLRFQNTLIMDILWFYELHNFPISLRRAHGAGGKLGELMQQCGSSHVPCGPGAALWVLPRRAGALACSGAFAPLSEPAGLSCNRQRTDHAVLLHWAPCSPPLPKHCKPCLV